MLQKCLVCCKNPLKRCKNALNMLQKFRNFTTHILLIIVIILIIQLLLLCVLSLLLIYFNNFSMILFRFISFFFIYDFVSTLFSLAFGYLFSVTYVKIARDACIIALYNDGSKASIRLSRRGKSCPAFTGINLG